MTTTNHKRIDELPAETSISNLDEIPFEVKSTGVTSKMTVGTLLNAVPVGVMSPAGADTQVQFNDGGAFGSDAEFVFDKATKTLITDIVRAEYDSTNYAELKTDLNGSIILTGTGWVYGSKIMIGDGAEVTDDYGGMAIGNHSYADYGGIAIGTNAEVTFGGTAIGVSAIGTQGLAVGGGANGTSGVAIGDSSYGRYGIAIGSYADTNGGTGNIAIGTRGSFPWHPATIPAGWTETTEIGSGTATLEGGLNYRTHGLMDGSGNIQLDSGKNILFSGSIISSSAIPIKSSGDTDDYIEISTVSNIPQIKTIGDYRLRLTSDDPTACYFQTYLSDTHYTQIGQYNMGDAFGYLFSKDDIQIYPTATLGSGYGLRIKQVAGGIEFEINADMGSPNLILNPSGEINAEKNIVLKSGQKMIFDGA